MKTEVDSNQNRFDDDWSWSTDSKSREVLLMGSDLRKVLFHPNWSNGTAGVRANKALQPGITYWEMRISNRLFGTSLMFGVVTEKARLHANSFIDLLGEDRNGWALSHKGHLFHDGMKIPYTKPFEENSPTSIGILYDGYKGTLSFYKDGKSLGTAFTGLETINEPLYPAVCSTAARTEITLSRIHRHYSINLQDQCKALILNLIMEGKSESTDCSKGRIDGLPLPNQLRVYLKEFLTDVHQNCNE